MIKSPCIKVCKKVDGYCIGCKRTIEEIAAWKTTMSDAEKTQLIETLKTRNIDAHLHDSK